MGTCNHKASVLKNNDEDKLPFIGVMRFWCNSSSLALSVVLS